MPTKYVAVNTTPLYKEKTGNAAAAHLLWGDTVRVESSTGGRRAARARGFKGYVDTTALGDERLLEVYFIDVGQGDAVLIRTPKGKTILIDGGVKRSQQPTKRNAADFVDWKFVKDLGTNTISLDVVIATHCDADHFGGLWDLLNPNANAELNAKKITVETAYHAGVSWWRKGQRGRSLGRIVKKDGRSYLVDLLESRDEIPELAGEWKQFMEAVDGTKRSGGGRTRLVRLSSAQHDYLPDFPPQQDDVAIRVLGPVEATIGGKPALPSFRGDSQSTNGNSVLLRLDYGRARVLLTGDLNTASQAALLEHYEGNGQEFECDVAKSCHHGSDDISYRFLQSLRAGATVISSGDAENYGHPRPSIVAASAVTGFRTVQDDRIVTPLVYSTEIARSYSLLELPKTKIELKDGTALSAARLSDAQVTFKVNQTMRTRPGSDVFVVAGVVYGLVNVRTDGRRILCATRNEKDATWHIKEFLARF